MTTIKITEATARKVLEVVDAGLVGGVGNPIPGQMCVEAAVCYALGLPHGDDPKCVAPSLRALKIQLNDSNWSSDEARAKGLRRLAVAQLGSAGVLDEPEFVRRLVDYAIRVSVPKALRIAAGFQKDPHRLAALISAYLRCEFEGTEAAAAAAVNAAARCAANAAAANAAARCAANAANAAARYAADAARYAADAARYAARYAANAAAAAARYAADADADDAQTARDRSLAEYAEAVVQILIELKAPGCQWLPLAEAA